MAGIWLDVACYADDNTSLHFLAKPRCCLEKAQLKIARLRYLNGFINTVLNQTSINATLSQLLSLKKEFKLERLLR